MIHVCDPGAPFKVRCAACEAEAPSPVDSLRSRHRRLGFVPDGSTCPLHPDYPRGPLGPCARCEREAN